MKKDMKRWLTLGALSAVVLAGCSNSSGGNESADGGDKDRKLIIYSNAASDGRGDFFVEKQLRQVLILSSLKWVDQKHLADC